MSYPLCIIYVFSIVIHLWADADCSKVKNIIRFRRYTSYFSRKYGYYFLFRRYTARINTFLDLCTVPFVFRNYTALSFPPGRIVLRLCQAARRFCRGWGYRQVGIVLRYIYIYICVVFRRSIIGILVDRREVVNRDESREGRRPVNKSNPWSHGRSVKSTGAQTLGVVVVVVLIITQQCGGQLLGTLVGILYYSRVHTPGFWSGVSYK